MRVRVKKEIVTLGVGEVDSVRNTGTKVPAAEWNALISDPNVLLHSGGALAGGGSCTLMVDVIASTVGSSLNISDLVYATESGYNFDLSTGVAQATLGVLAPPAITKDFDPNLVLLGVTPGDASVLTFTITNPNPSNAISGVAFTDTFPASLVVATAASSAAVPLDTAMPWRRPASPSRWPWSSAQTPTKVITQAASTKAWRFRVAGSTRIVAADTLRAMASRRESSPAK